MLTLRLMPYASTDWSWNQTGYTTADHTSLVVPYAHPMVEQLAVTDGIRTLLVIRERVAGRPLTSPHPRTVPPPPTTTRNWTPRGGGLWTTS